MKIAIVGSAPSSMGLAPFGDPAWQIWGCSPGLYANAPRVDAWFELHRYEPPVIGKPAQQVPWFSPEYCAWMAQQKLVWMYEKVASIPGSDVFPTEELCRKFGNFFMTSSIAWMMAMAIDQILLERETRTVPAAPGEYDTIGLFGVDMAASEEYGYQRAGCQYFIQMAINLGITVKIPPESDLLRPMPMYGIWESSHFAIKMTARKREMTTRMQQHQAQAAEHNNQAVFLRGALDDLEYMIQTWHEGKDAIPTHVDIWARSPYLIKQAVPDPVSVVPHSVVWVADPLADNPFSTTSLSTAPRPSEIPSTASFAQANAKLAKLPSPHSKKPRKRK